MWIKWIRGTVLLIQVDQENGSLRVQSEVLRKKEAQMMHRGLSPLHAPNRILAFLEQQ
jgi:hypothetical protein